MKINSHFSKTIQIQKPSTIIPQEEYDSLLETLEILSNNRILSRIESALSNIKKCKVFTHKDVFGHSL